MNHLQEKYQKQIEQMIEACKRSGALGYGAGSRRKRLVSRG